MSYKYGNPVVMVGIFPRNFVEVVGNSSKVQRVVLEKGSRTVVMHKGDRTHLPKGKWKVTHYSKWGGGTWSKGKGRYKNDQRTEFEDIPGQTDFDDCIVQFS